jgi:hypothetical protein
VKPRTTRASEGRAWIPKSREALQPKCSGVDRPPVIFPARRAGPELLDPRTVAFDQSDIGLPRGICRKGRFCFVNQAAGRILVAQFEAALGRIKQDKGVFGHRLQKLLEQRERLAVAACSLQQPGRNRGRGEPSISPRLGFLATVAPRPERHIVRNSGSIGEDLRLPGQEPQLLLRRLRLVNPLIVTRPALVDASQVEQVKRFAIKQPFPFVRRPITRGQECLRIGEGGRKLVVPFEIRVTSCL